MFNLKTRKSRLLAIIVAAAIAVTALAVGLGSTLAAKPDIAVNFTQPNSYLTIEKGSTLDRGTLGGWRVSSSDESRATVTINSATAPAMVTMAGVKAGVVAFTIGSTEGLLLRWTYQITDSGNLTGYTIKRGGEVVLNGPSTPGKTFSLTANSFVTTTPASALGTIKWRSLQESIATVSASGLITAKSGAKGVAIIVGEFTDKWGVDHDLHILVGVGVGLGGNGDDNNPDLSDLLEWIRRGEAILGLDPNPYTSESLSDLETAVNGGKNVLDMSNPTDKQIKDAVNDIKKAIEDLELKGGDGGIIGPDPDGNYYKPVGDPPNVYEIVDKDGKSKYQPPRYIYNPRNPAQYPGDNRPAEKDGYKYYVEDPDGSNIWKRVDGNGNLDDNDAIWGGPDGKPGGGDDKPVKKFGSPSAWWVSMGQNVWRKVNGPFVLGPLTGGGGNRNPATSPVAKIFDYTAKDGRYYVGPLGPDDTGHEYYYGDPRTGGDGYLDSTETSRNGDDVKYYLVNGEMVTTPPTGDPGVASPGRVLPPEKTGDTVDWIEIATWGSYSLIVRKSYINWYAGRKNQPDWQYTNFGSNANYKGSTVQSKINSWFSGTVSGSDVDNLPASAPLRQFTMQHNALDKLGTASTIAAQTDGFSKPTAYQVGTGDNIAFALSFSEARMFVSKTHDVRTSNPQVQSSSAAASANWGKLSVPNTWGYGTWLRSSGDVTGTAGAINYDGRAFQFWLTPTSNAEYGLIYPALWVKQAIFN